MSVSNDGSQLFGIQTQTFTEGSKGFIIESFTNNKTTNRVDLNDGDGLALGAVVVPQREEASFTVQIGTTTALPDVGDTFTYAATGASAVTYMITEVSVNETQEDFVRLNISAFKKTDQSA